MPQPIALTPYYNLVVLLSEVVSGVFQEDPPGPVVHGLKIVVQVGLWQTASCACATPQAPPELKAISSAMTIVSWKVLVVIIFNHQITRVHIETVHLLKLGKEASGQ